MDSATSEKIKLNTISESEDQMAIASSQQPQTRVKKPRRPVEGRKQHGPIRRSSYIGLPQTPAVKFLANIAEGWTEQDDSLPPTEVKEGTVIGDYTFGRIIGRGTFSDCREAFKTSMPAVRMAIKILPLNQAELRESAENQVKFWSNLDHPRILQLIDVVRLHDVVLIVSPLAERGSLLKYLQRHGALDEMQARKILFDVCHALQYLHIEKRTVHYNLKLENILLDKNLNAYIADFALSEKIDGDSKTGSNESDEARQDLMMKGSLWYLPPEVIDTKRSREIAMKDNPELAQGDWKLEKTKVDVWALGVITYAMIMVGLPFTQDYLPRLQQAILDGDYEPLPEEVDANLRDLVCQLLQTDPEKRPLIDQVLDHDWLNSDEDISAQEVAGQVSGSFKVLSIYEPGQ